MASSAKEKTRMDTTGEALTIDAKMLARAMKSAAAIVENRNTIPILANVALAVTDGNLVISTTDLDIEYRQIIAVDTGASFATTVDAKRLNALCGATDAGAVLKMTSGDGKLTIAAGRSRWQLPTIPVDDFPSLTMPDVAHEITISGKSLAEFLRRTAWAASTEVTRYYLNGVYFDAFDGSLTLASADGNVCAVIETGIATHVDMPAVILPTKYLAALASLAGAFDGPITMAWDERKVRAVIGDVVLTGKTIDGTFVPYRRVTPSLQETFVAFDPGMMASALRRINVVSDSMTRAVLIQRGDGKLTVSASSSSGGAAGEEVPAECAEGPDIGINSAYLANMIGGLGGDTIEMHQVDAGAPILFRRTVYDGMIAVLMPMRV